MLKEPTTDVLGRKKVSHRSASIAAHADESTPAPGREAAALQGAFSLAGAWPAAQLGRAPVVKDLDAKSISRLRPPPRHHRRGTTDPAVASNNHARYGLLCIKGLEIATFDGSVMETVAATAVRLRLPAVAYPAAVLPRPVAVTAAVVVGHRRVHVVDHRSPELPHETKGDLLLGTLAEQDPIRRRSSGASSYRAASAGPGPRLDILRVLAARQSRAGFAPHQAPPPAGVASRRRSGPPRLACATWSRRPR